MEGTRPGRPCLPTASASHHPSSCRRRTARISPFWNPSSSGIWAAYEYMARALLSLVKIPSKKSRKQGKLTIIQNQSSLTVIILWLSKTLTAHSRLRSHGASRSAVEPKFAAHVRTLRAGGIGSAAHTASVLASAVDAAITALATSGGKGQGHFAA